MSTRTSPQSTAAPSPPVFNLTRAIELLDASAESGIAFGTPWQPYSAGEGLRTSFLVGEGAPFLPFNEQSSDAYTDIVRLGKDFYLRVIKDERHQTSRVIVPGEDWLKIAFPLGISGLAQTFGSKSPYQHTAGRVEIYAHPQGMAKTESVEGGCWGSSVALYVSRGFLGPHVESELDRMPEAILEYLKGTPKELILETVPLTGSIMRAVVDIVSTKYLGHLRHTYVKAKAYELLCEVIYLLTREGRPSGCDLRLSWHDKRKLGQVREFIQQDCVNVPAIAVLARRVGLNQHKLKTGFKQLFGIPIFQYTQQLRLEKALQMLLTGDYAVCEVADATGYRFSKNFTTAFKKRYGVSPKIARKSFDRPVAPSAGDA